MQRNPALMHNYAECQLDRGYGYYADYDERDDGYLMRDVAKYHFLYTGAGPQQPGKIKPERILDQGVTRLSPAYAWRHWLSATPNSTPLGPDVMTLIDHARKYVTMDANAPTTIRACAHALMELGHIERFLWAKSAYDMANWISAGFGPIVVTAPWYEDMDDPTVLVAHARGEIKTWHSFLILSYMPSRSAFVLLNSHGLYWGRNGKKQLPFTDMQFLFENGAIACSSPTKTVGARARDVVQHNRKVVVEL
jgi:hypothetical protein